MQVKLDNLLLNPKMAQHRALCFHIIAHMLNVEQIKFIYSSLHGEDFNLTCRDHKPIGTIRISHLNSAACAN